MTRTEMRMIGPDEVGMRLDRWFKYHFPEVGHAYLEKLIRTGQVRINGRRVRAGTHLQAEYCIRIPPLQERSIVRERRESQRRDDYCIRLQSMIVYSDEEVLVVNKPRGLAVQGGRGVGDHLDGWLQALRVDSEERLRLVHRLDREVSGLLVLARTAFAARKLGRAFREGLVEKTYCAITWGVLSPERGRIKTLLGKSGQRMCVTAEVGKWSETVYRVVDRVGESMALVALNPLTGRKHQLRVHLAQRGAPILGDHKYGYDHMGRGHDALSPHLHLHASHLVFPHPRGGSVLVGVPLAKHMEETCSWLGLEYRSFFGDRVFYKRLL